LPSAKAIQQDPVVLYVVPRLVDADNMLFNVENENSGVLVKAAFADEQFWYGKGAGGHPTGSAVRSDIAALRYGYRYEYTKHLESQELKYARNYDLKVYRRYEDEDLLENVEFKSISERFYSENAKYVIGYISLQEIIDKRDIINQEGNFLAELPV